MSHHGAEKGEKTIAIRLLEARGYEYEVFTFSDTIHDASEAAHITGHSAGEVFKTLVVLREEARSKPLLMMIPADCTLDLRKAARALDVRKLRMAKHDEAEVLTGLQVGGISALALLNRGFEIYLDERAVLYDRILISAGRRGINIRVSVDDLLEITAAEWIDAATEMA